MAEAREKRIGRERETLMYSTPEEAQAWRERVQEKIRNEAGKSVQRPREVVAEQLAHEFANEGQGVSLSRPWEHSAAEHAEAQELVDITFAVDLPAALKHAKRSPNWPRNIDLFHDVLTTEMYELVREHKLNQQPVTGWILLSLGVVLLAFVAIGVLLLAIK